jgi:two-component system, OmpR family, response regulator YxdJ
MVGFLWLHRGGKRMTTIMIVEDDEKIATLLQEHLFRYGYKAERVTDFTAVLDVFLNIQPQLVLLDVNLPRYDGYYWCRQIRRHSTCPILFISAREGQMDQVMALENGADDYITKPFHYEVVIAKIRSHLRRAYGEYAGGGAERRVEVNGLTLFPERLELAWQGKKVELGGKEALLLEALLKRPGRVATRDVLLEILWNEQAFVDDNTLNVYINRVRGKLKELGITGLIETVRGTGYRLKPPGEEGA